MTDEQQPDANKDFPNSSDNSSFPLEEKRLNPGSEAQQSKSTQGDENKKECYSHPNVIVNVPQANDAGSVVEARKANKLTKIGLIISTILALLTLGALGFTWWSVDVAQQALTDSRKKD